MPAAPTRGSALGWHVCMRRACTPPTRVEGAPSLSARSALLCRRGTSRRDRWSLDWRHDCRRLTRRERPQLLHELRHFLACQRLDERGNLCDHLRHVGGDLVDASTFATSRHYRDAIHLAERLGKG